MAEMSKTRGGLSRRGFIKGVGAVAVAGCAAHQGIEVKEEHPQIKPAEMILRGAVPIVLTVNGQDRPVTVEPRTTLLSSLRDRLDPAITGPKLVCDAGTCGACTVLLNGKPVYGCSVLAIDAVGKEITTVEGIGTPEHLSAVQAAFVEKDGMMCGYCTSGFVTTITALIRDNPNPTLEQVKEGCKGNFCRCGTYPHVFAAALTAAKNSK
jgi:xanthine dehydrogenase YagT iron-sulfur-binding subunit